MKARYILLLACLLGATPSLFAQNGSITVAPPPLVAYEQPPCPAEGYFWSPGYWAYGEDGYFWVPGTWVEVPQPGYFWTPGYWAFANGYYLWHGGYWGPHVGFYGGINYGYGYYGSGFYGGRWDGNIFRYNTAAWHVNSAVIHNTYADRTVINQGAANSHVSFNGPGGIEARPTAGEEAAAQNRRLEATSAQRAHEQEARNDRNQHYSVNQGHPNTLVRTNAAGQPAGVHHESGQPATVHHEGGQPAAGHHDGAQPEAVHHEGPHPEVGHPEATHPETAHHEVARPEAHHEAVHTQATHHEVAHPQPTHHVAAPHQPSHPPVAHPAGPHHPPAHSQPKKPSGGGEKKG